ncbi:Cell division-associated, ATP-dependent zinc metalloprotease FtsH [Candidatus Phytoplasma rubi]|uniref:Cell division-associated, ATP-dependent zinc metalloprotease FtsH n=1 Tax=Candidatus Phytoplasma rubi TaxID=399025 RepID=A0ABY7BTI3_9MOLU|nr:AAA family ATPase [Candidatus Phytoplasma rubi]WAN63612.1 Cell division-associated, ATP-dependent zinc metalloprotease FtsH [Candidatus Phytoplasma rubi]
MNWQPQIFENPQGNKPIPPPLSPKKKNLKYYLSIVQIIVNIVFYILMIFFFSVGISSISNIKNVDVLNDSDKKWAEDKIIKENNLTIKDDFQSSKFVKKDMNELIDNIKNKNQDIPRGFLLHGPPGTGKTYLAKCLAGSLRKNASFYVVNGSEFVEKYVGVGAARIRKLFKTARETAFNKGQRYFFIFIDEIDSIGRKRSSEGNTNIEIENSLNALLSEIDGFNSGEGKSRPPYGIVFGSTNRKDLLDEALIREGRLGKHIYLGHPNQDDIRNLLEYFIKKYKFSFKEEEKKNLSHFLSKNNFTASGMNSLIKEVNKLVNKSNNNEVTIDNFYDAWDEVVLGPKNTVPRNDLDQDRIIIHELGHAVVSKAFGFKVHRINVESRGDKGGYTLFLPNDNKDINLLTRDDLLKRIIIFLGGRAAESIFYESVSIGSCDDLKKVQMIASEMIEKLGMFDSEGNKNIFENKFLEQDTKNNEKSELLKLVANEQEKEQKICNIISNSYNIARDIIKNYFLDPKHIKKWKYLEKLLHTYSNNKINNEQFESDIDQFDPNDNTGSFFEFL